MGIFGGMGTEASAELYKRIVRMCQRDFGARVDDEVPPIVIYNLPLPDIVPCNTVTYFLDGVKATIPINTPTAVTDELRKRNTRSVGLLAALNIGTGCSKTATCAIITPYCSERISNEQRGGTDVRTR